MPQNDRTPVTRRRALSASLTALLATGTASVLPPAAHAAPEPTSGHHEPLAPATVVVDQAALDALAQRASDESRRTLQVAADLSHGADREAYEEAFHNHLGATFDHYIADLARHLPAFAPTIFAVWDHLLEAPGYSDELCCQEPTRLASDRA